MEKPGYNVIPPSTNKVARVMACEGYTPRVAQILEEEHLQRLAQIAAVKRGSIRKIEGPGDWSRSLNAVDLSPRQD